MSIFEKNLFSIQNNCAYIVCTHLFYLQTIAYRLMYMTIYVGVGIYAGNKAIMVKKYLDLSNFT